MIEQQVLHDFVSTSYKIYDSNHNENMILVQPILSATWDSQKASKTIDKKLKKYIDIFYTQFGTLKFS